MEKKRRKHRCVFGSEGRAKEVEEVTTSKLEITYTVQNSRGEMG